MAWCEKSPIEGLDCQCRNFYHLCYCVQILRNFIDLTQDGVLWKKPYRFPIPAAEGFLPCVIVAPLCAECEEFIHLTPDGVVWKKPYRRPRQDILIVPLHPATE